MRRVIKIKARVWFGLGRRLSANLTLALYHTQVTISNMEGETTKQQGMRGVPQQMMFADKKEEVRNT